ncbi:MAG: GNAT family N-acetyltransferase [Actinomycetota bacterium]|nr:GNAT family N-acetyltransferase [Actinomycetota bacterium]
MTAMLRRATPEDAERLAWLRATSFGTQTAMPDLEAPMADVLRSHLRAGDFGAFLVEDGSVPVSYGIAMIHQRLPCDWNPSGRWGYVQSLETRPDHRGRGHATAILAALLEWYAQEGVPSVGLLSAALAEPLYRRLGFKEEPTGRWLVRRDQHA